MAKAILILLLNHGGATFDAWSTRRLMGRYSGIYEMNPIERPFAGSSALYLTSQGDAIIADVLMLHKWTNRKPKVASDILEAASFSSHAYSGVHNLRLGSYVAGLEGTSGQRANSAEVVTFCRNGNCLLHPQPMWESMNRSLQTPAR